MAAPTTNLDRTMTVTLANPTPPTNSVVNYQGTPPTPRGLAAVQAAPPDTVNPWLTADPLNGAASPELAGKAEADGTEVTTSSANGRVTGHSVLGNWTENPTTDHPSGGGAAPIPPIGASGWTTLTASADTRTVYVSATGNNSNDGLTTGTPKLTIAAGLALLRDGFPDWLLFKKGDTWTNQEIGYFEKKGRSSIEPMLFSSYGTGARPLIKTSDAGSGAAIGAFNVPSINVAVVGLEFYAYKRNPADPGYVGPGLEQNNFRLLNNVSNLLIEDCVFRFYGGGTIEGISSNVRIRRSAFLDNYETGASHAQGLFIDNITGLLVDECLFDRNGWNPTVAGAGGTIFNHGLYIQYNCGPATVTNNIFTNSSATGVQVRSGGTVTGNLMVRNPVGFQIGSSSGTIPTPIPPGSATVSGNLVMEGNDIPVAGDPRGWGFVLYANTGLVTFQNNIIAHVSSVAATNIIGIYIDTGANNDIVTNNIIYDWGGAGIIDNGSGNTTTPNQIAGSGYLDPTRTVATYMTSIGGTGTLDAFIVAARAQSKEVGWNVNYTAAPVINYVAQGFVAGVPAGITQVGSAVTIGSPNSGTVNGGSGRVVSSTITVPAGTELMIVAMIGYNNTASFFSGGTVDFPKGGTATAMTVVPGGGDLVDHVGCAMWYMNAPDIGTNKTLHCFWSSTTSATTVEALWSITFWKGASATPVRGGNGNQSAAAAVAVATPTLTALSGDLIVSFAGGYNGAADESATFDTWLNLTKLADVTHYANFDGAWATSSPTGNVAVGLSTGTNIGYTAIKAVVIKPAP